MKNFGLILLAIFLCLGTVFDLSAQNKTKKKKTEEVIFLVSMHCDNCKKKIEKNISWEKGVKDLRIDLENKKVTILYNPAENNKEQLKTAIEKLSFTCEIVEKEKDKS